MKFRTALALLALSMPALGMSQKPKVSVRFHPEANPNDGTTFVMPVKLQYLRRDAYLSRVPAFSEKQIKAIYPFQADDNTWGCVFQLDEQGRIRLETMSSEQLNTALVLFVATKGGQHQVIDMLIDRPVTSGRITVPRGLTEAEVVVMKTQFPVIGEVKGKPNKKKDEEKEKKEKEKANDVTDWRMARGRDGSRAPSMPPSPIPTIVSPAPTRPASAAPSSSRPELRALDTPRVAD